MANGIVPRDDVRASGDGAGPADLPVLESTEDRSDLCEGHPGDGRTVYCDGSCGGVLRRADYDAASAVTDDQLFDLLALARQRSSSPLHRAPIETEFSSWSEIQQAAETALGRRKPRTRGDKARARARCAELLSDPRYVP